jgi:hypothetical protein
MAAKSARVLRIVGVDSATQEGLLGLPLGPALLGFLGDLNSDVSDALADERARLSRDGYPADLPLPALWWAPAPALGAKGAEAAA